jgi:CRP-like cAMP-binding protein
LLELGRTESGSANPFLRKLESLAVLDAEDVRIARALVGPTRTVEARADIVEEGRPPGACTILIEGLACRYKALDDGRRQILSLHVPGDVLDLHGVLLGRLDHSVATLSRCRVAPIAADALLETLDRHPNLRQAFWRSSLLDGALFRAWLVALGQRPAHERVAHLFSEVDARLTAADATRGDTLDFPITQEELADALGLSVVHVNRVLQRLRRDGLITLRARKLSIHDRDALRRLGGFDGRYLSVGPDATEGATPARARQA